MKPVMFLPRISNGFANLTSSDLKLFDKRGDVNTSYG